MAALQQALVAFGANLGVVDSMWKAILADLRQCHQMEIDAVSSLTRSRAIGGPPGQPDYGNAAIRLRTTLDPYELLETLLQLEARRGRIRSQLWSPRTVDLDLLLLEHEIIETDRLSLPHPRLALRPFVLRPAVEIAADMVDPRTGRRLDELWENLRRRPFVLEVWGETTAAVRQCNELLAGLIRKKGPPLAGAVVVRESTAEPDAVPPNLVLDCRPAGRVQSDTGGQCGEMRDRKTPLAYRAPVLHLDLADGESLRRELSAVLQALEE